MRSKNERKELFSPLKSFLKEYILTPQPKPMGLLSRDGAVRTVRCLSFLLWLVFPFLCLVFAEYICFMTPGEPIFGEINLKSIVRLFTDNADVLLFDLILLYTLSFVISFLTKRLWASCAIIGTVSFLLPAVSFFKFQNTGEYFYPWDLTQTGNAGLLSDYINTTVPAALFIIGAVVIFVTVFVLVTRVSVPVRWNIRVPAAVITILALFISYSSTEGAARLIERHGMSFDSVYRGTENYSENGFIGGLMLNVLSETVESPDEYTEDAIREILSDYTGKEASENFASPNVIVILQESFWDVRQLPGCTFSQNPLENYDKILSRDGVYSGSVISPTFGGGTVRPEFEVLSGLSADYLPAGSIPYQYIESSFESYPLMLKDSGYSTVAIHPYQASFYSRNEKYPLIGFDSTYFASDLLKITEVKSTKRGGFVSDESFVSYIEYFIEETTSPLFLFGISMEGHQPYAGKFNDSELRISVTNSSFDEELSAVVTQYSQCVMDADASLGHLTEYIDSLDEDTILIVFGDHAPSLGSDKAAYRKSGFISDFGLTAEDMEKILNCPFFIYANFETEKSTMLHEGKGNSISPYNLMNAALELTGAPETPLMDFLKDYYSICPVYNVKLTLTLSPVAERFVKAHEFLSHDRLRGEGYSVND